MLKLATGYNNEVIDAIDTTHVELNIGLSWNIC